MSVSIDMISFKNEENETEKLIEGFKLSEFNLNKQIHKLKIQINNLTEEKKIDKTLIEKLTSSSSNEDKKNSYNNEIKMLLSKIKKLEDRDQEYSDSIYKLKIELSNKQLEINKLKITNFNDYNSIDSTCSNTDSDSIIDVKLDSKKQANKRLSTSNTFIVINKANKENDGFRVDLELLNEDPSFNEFCNEAKILICDLMNENEKLKESKTQISQKALETLAEKELEILDLRNYVEGIEQEYQNMMSNIENKDKEINNLKNEIRNKLKNNNNYKLEDLSEAIEKNINLLNRRKSSMLQRNSTINVNVDKFLEITEKILNNKNNSTNCRKSLLSNCEYDQLSSNNNLNDEISQNLITPKLSMNANDDIHNEEQILNRIKNLTEEYEEQLDNLTKENERLILEMNMNEENYKIELGNLEKDNICLKNDVMYLKTELKMYEKNKNLNNNQSSDLLKEIKHLEQKCSLIQESKERSDIINNSNIKELESKIARINREKIALIDKNSMCEKSIINLLKQKEDMTNQFQQKIIILEEEKSNIEENSNTTISNLQNTIKNIISQNEKNKKANENIKKEYTELLENFKNLKQTIDEDNRKNNSANINKISLLEKEISRLQKIINDLKKTIDNNKENNQTNEDGTSLSNIIYNDKNGSVNNNDSNIIHELNEETRMLKLKNNQYMDDLVIKTKEINLLKLDISNLKQKSEEQIKFYEQKLNNVKENTDSIRHTSIYENKNITTKFKDEISKLTAENNYYKQQLELVEKLKNEYNSLNDKSEFSNLELEYINDLKKVKVDYAYSVYNSEIKMQEYRKYIKKLKNKFGVVESKRIINSQNGTFATNLFK